MTLLQDVKTWRQAERVRLIAERMGRPIEVRRVVRQQVQAILEAEVPQLRRAMIGFYWPFRGEIDFVRFVRGLLHNGSQAALPVVVEKGRPLEFWRWTPGMAMRPGIWDIPVPAIADPVQPDCLLVPLVGFDEAGYRLGYGGGYYDRTLAAIQYWPLAIGVGYEFQALPSIRPQLFDLPMDAIVTETGIRWYRQPAQGTESDMAIVVDDSIECSSPPCLLGDFS